MTLVDSGTVKRGRRRLRFCAGKSLSLYYCSFNMKLCSWGDLVLLTSVSLQHTKPLALRMIYIHGKWQLEQESRDVILPQTGNKASGPTPFPPNSPFTSIEQGAQQSYHSMLTEQNKTWLEEICGNLQGPVKYAENRNGLKPARAIPYIYIYIAQWH